ncbi:MAG: ABC transporter permease [Ktedonobacteraceae bacterium]
MSEIIDKNATPGSSSGQSAAVEVPSYRQRQTFAQLLRNDLGFVPVLLTLIAIAVYFGVTTNGIFFEPRNLSELLQQIATIGVDALGVTLVLLLGEIDLSVASVTTLCAVVMGILSERSGFPAWEAILLGILSGAFVGFINGIFIAVLRIPSFIVTLAASIGYAGLLLRLLNAQSTLIVHDPVIDGISGSATSYLSDAFGIGLPTLVLLGYIGILLYDQMRRRKAGLRAKSTLQLIAQIVLMIVVIEGAVILFQSYQGVPNSTAILFALILIVWVVLTKTPFGRHIYAVGGNIEAARRAGINVVFIRVAVFTLCSALAAVGGILAASHQNAVASQVSSTLLLQAIGAAVIGGVSLFGGRGSVWSIVLGTLIIGSLENGLGLKSQGSDVQQMVEGVVLLLAVTVDAVVRRAQSRSSSGR